MKYFTSQSPSVSVRRRELAHALRMIRMENSISLEQIAESLHRALRQDFHRERYQRTTIAKLFFSRGVDAIEEGTEGVIGLTYDDCKLLAQVYGVHSLLLHPLLTSPSEDVCLIEKLDDFLLVGDPDDETFGVHAQYGTPSRKLAGTENVAVVDLRIDQGGRSDVHSHPGDELMFVRRGTIDVLLRNTGLRARLNQGDYLHFYAEQEHCAFNATTERAELFILRFRFSGRRSELLRGLHAKKPKKLLVSQAIRELLLTVAPYPVATGQEGQPSEPNAERQVLDRFGLGRLLQLLGSERFCAEGARLTLDELARKGARFRFTRAKIHRIRHGLAAVTQADLMNLAEIYGVKPMLFYDYLFPVLRNAIAVRQHGEPEVSFQDVGEMRALPPQYVGESRARYRVPCRRLADTDVAIANLELPPGGTTPENRHPGHEILLPLKGRFIVRFGQTLARVNAEEGTFAHFHSHRRHQVVNMGHETAEALVIRMYE